MNLNKELEQLLKEFDFHREGKNYRDILNEAIRDIMAQKCSHKKVAVRGAGEHTDELFQLFPQNVEIVGVFANSVNEEQKKVYGNYKCNLFPSGKIKEFQFDSVLISSYQHRNEMRKELEQEAGEFEIIDLYEELKRVGFHVHEAFYYNTEGMYESVAFDRRQYQEADTQSEKEKCLLNLILSYINIRDFVNALHFMDIYLEHGSYQKIRIEELKERILQFLSDIKRQIQDRKQRDILVIWNDQLGYGELASCQFLKNQSEESLFLENAFTTAPFTYPAFWAIFGKAYSIDNELYFGGRKRVDKNNALIATLSKKGYDFRYIGDGPIANALSKEYAVGYPSYESSCMRCFQMLDEVINSEKPICIMLHEVVETHNPFLSGELEEPEWLDWPYIDKDMKKAELQIAKSAEYWSKQLSFYMDFFGEQTTKVYMSDHGKRYEAEPVYLDLATHIILFVKDRRLKNKRESNLFEITHIYELLDYLSDKELRNDKYPLLFSNDIKMQEVGIFNETAIQYYLDKGAAESAMPFRAARGKEDKYILLNTGKEYYYRLPNEEKNEIGNPLYQDRIAHLKSQAGNHFLDFHDYYEELVSFRKLYEAQ